MIRFPNWQSAGGTFTGGLIASGWRQAGGKQTQTTEQSQVVYQRYQGSGLSRPGNLGTAYTGAWTGNISSAPLDQHTPIRFKRVNSLVAELRRVVRNQLLRT